MSGVGTSASGVPGRRRMPVKYWSFAGLLLTYRCNARCASCYVCAGPADGPDMDVQAGLEYWSSLQAACPHGCRIHIGGGEPFLCWETLLELARRARAAGLGPLEAVETNAFWATRESIVRRRLRALDEAGMRRLTISADPYHQQFVPIQRVRLAARVAEEVLGTDRVRIRWRDWAASGFDTGALAPDRREEVFARYARNGRDRITGRAADALAGFLPRKPARAFADSPCWDRLLRSRHVHVDPAGRVCPGTCAGIVLGRIGPDGSVGEIWRRLSERFADTDENLPPGASGGGVLAVLARRGPAGLARLAAAQGYEPDRSGYAGKCHLCWDVRRWLLRRGLFREELGPAEMYRS